MSTTADARRYRDDAADAQHIINSARMELTRARYRRMRDYYLACAVALEQGRPMPRPPI
jgi:hypothetical protein